MYDGSIKDIFMQHFGTDHIPTVLYLETFMCF